MRPLLAVLLLLVAGCGNDDRDEVVVFAASSLTRTLTSIAEEYEQAHPSTDVVLSFAGSQSLVAQVEQGAPADVIATADERTMARLRTRLIGPPAVFARNRLAVLATSSSGVTRLTDLGRRDLRVVLGAPSVPVGAASRSALAEAGIVVRPVSLEPDVASVVAKVRAGEADAAIVYATDVAAAPDGTAGFVLPGAATALPVGALTDRGREFTEHLLSPRVRAALVADGFLPP